MPRRDIPGICWTLAHWVALSLVLVSGWNFHAPDGPHELSLIGGIGMTVSLAIAVAGFVGLGKNLSPWPQPHRSNSLVTHGIYRFIRHPLYLSLVIFAIGWSIWRQSIPAIICSLLLLWVLRRKAAHEEKHLMERHPQYLAYAKNTGGFLPSRHTNQARS
jgi:protein-S-isoprenylcysteine O-methyltransferase Ste14